MRTRTAPGGVESGHVDAYVKEHLPPADAVARTDFRGIPALAAYRDRINAARELLEEGAYASGDTRPAFVYPGGCWTRGQLRDQVRRIARVLVREHGLVPGGRVLLRGPNTPMLAASWLAVLEAGGVCVATMPLLRAGELTTVLERSQAGLALCDLRFAAELERSRPVQVGSCRVAHFTPLGDGKSSAADLDVSALRARAVFDAIDTAADDPALIAFTSGTTGLPKGAVHFHRDVLAMCDTFGAECLGSGPEDVHSGSPPLAFTFGLGGLLCMPMRAGAAVALIEQPSPEALRDAIDTLGATVLFTAPTMYRKLLDEAPRATLSRLRCGVSAGEHLPLETARRWREATGRPLLDGLGTTEMIHVFLASGPETPEGSTGVPVPGYEVCVLDDDGSAAPPDVVGRLAVRGPTACRYLDDEERQRKAVLDGWNLTGDLFTRDSAGYFWYRGRADDLIISSGYNIAGIEVEEALLGHPGVAECAVVGSPDPERGSIVKAFVVPAVAVSDAESFARELQEHVKQRIAPYKYPRRIQLVESLPRTPTGKLKRGELRLQESGGEAS